ncbi:MAG: hypothetical protein JXA18_10095 [Chitinispirillaceae bacterium]|nr:hypothetical protein [Chitinispirillaceae bacterium]
MNSAVFKRPEAAVITAAVSIPILGYIDYLTGREFGFFIFYFFPILYTAWYCRLTSSVAISVLSALVWFAADFLLTPHYASHVYSLWNSIIRLFVFMLIVYFVFKIKQSIAAERKISDDLRTALAQVKTLRGLIPICAACKKIRNDQGYWERIEKYIEDHSEADFSHGICEECARKLYPEIFNKEKKAEE